MVRQLPVNLKHFTANKHDAFSISLLDNLADPAIWPTRERKREQKRSRTCPRDRTCVISKLSSGPVKSPQKKNSAPPGESPVDIVGGMTISRTSRGVR